MADYNYTKGIFLSFPLYARREQKDAQLAQKWMERLISTEL